MLPFIQFDEIIKLKSFDDYFLSRFEIGYLIRLAIPKNLTEAERINDTRNFIV